METPSYSHYKTMGVFFNLSRADNSVVGGPIGPKFELVQDIMHVFNIWIGSKTTEKKRH